MIAITCRSSQPSFSSTPSLIIPPGQFQGGEIEPGTFHVRLLDGGLTPDMLPGLNIDSGLDEGAEDGSKTKSSNENSETTDEDTSEAQDADAARPDLN